MDILGYKDTLLWYNFHQLDGLLVSLVL